MEAIVTTSCDICNTEMFRQVIPLVSNYCQIIFHPYGGKRLGYCTCKPVPNPVIRIAFSEPASQLTYREVFEMP